MRDLYTPKKEDMTQKQIDTIMYIVKNDIHKKIAYSIIKHYAFKDVAFLDMFLSGYENNKIKLGNEEVEVDSLDDDEKKIYTKEVFHTFHKGLKDRNVEDIEQEVFINLFQLVSDNLCNYVEGRQTINEVGDYEEIKEGLHFATYSTSKRDKVSYLCKIYGTILNYMNKEKKDRGFQTVHRAKRDKNGKVIKDSNNKTVYEKTVVVRPLSVEFTFENEDNVITKEVSINSNDYRKLINLQANSNSDYLSIKSLNKDKIKLNELLLNFCNKYPKLKDDALNIFCGLFDGLKYEEIEKKYNISIRRIKYIIPILHKYFNDNFSFYYDLYIDKCNGYNTTYINKEIQTRQNETITISHIRELTALEKNYTYENTYYTPLKATDKMGEVELKLYKARKKEEEKSKEKIELYHKKSRKYLYTYDNSGNLLHTYSIYKA